MANQKSIPCELVMNGSIGNLSPRMKFDSVNAAVTYARLCDLYAFYTVYDMTGRAIKRGRCGV